MDLFALVTRLLYIMERLRQGLWGGGTKVMNRLRFAIALISLLILHCSSAKYLSDTEKAKLDRHLVRLLSGEQVDETLFNVQEKPDGTKLYKVIIRSNQAEDLKRLGICVSSVFSDVIVARATIPQLWTLVASPSVHAIQTGTTNSPQPYH
jgi:hypothetical protein